MSKKIVRLKNKATIAQDQFISYRQEAIPNISNGAIFADID